eukprot:4813678-Karenia_brevis.AAC.1
MVSTLGKQLFHFAGYAVIERTGSPNAHQLVKLKPWITMVLTIFPDGHPDRGVIRGAGHALIVKERMKESPFKLNTSQRSDHDFMDW